jgi:thiamine biosynthesis lipoprotein
MKRYSFAIPLAVVAVLVVFTLLRQGGEDVPEYRDSRLMMDTFVEIRLWGEGDVPGEAALDSAFAAMAHIDRLLGDGLITARDSAAFDAPAVDSIMAVSALAWRLTGGEFDPTIGAVSRLWEFYPDSAPPDADSLKAGLKAVGFGRYLAASRSPGGDIGPYVLDIGGVAKGYAVDLAARVIERLGFPAALINAGGDIRLVGHKPGGGPWRIAVRHPRKQNEFIGCLEVGPVSIATSGDYERCFTYEGVRYHHILDPADGMPARGAISVTVIGRDAGLCDALATGLFVLGGRRALALAESLPGIEAVVVPDEACEALVTTGAADAFEEVGR